MRLIRKRSYIARFGFFEKNSTSQEMKFIRRIVAADILLYESSAPADFFILADRRYVNCNFLVNNLKYSYKVKRNIAYGKFRLGEENPDI